MAGDWIKVEVAAPDKPEVFDIAASLQIEPNAALGALIRVWAWFDQHTENGNGRTVSQPLIDHVARQNGLADAMLNVGWLVRGEAGYQLPNFDRHNGETAKTRALTAKRVAKHKRNANAIGNGQENDAVTQTELPREEKRREEVLRTPANAGVSTAPPCPHLEIIKLYHDILPTARAVDTDLWKGARATHLQARWRESKKRQNLDWWKRFFNYIGESDFLCGRTPPRPGKGPFVLTLGWIVNLENFTKIHEGAYNT